MLLVIHNLYCKHFIVACYEYKIISHNSSRMPPLKKRSSEAVDYRDLGL